jgi:hypothetical protein
MSAFHDGTSHRGRSIQGSQLQLGDFIMSFGVGGVQDGTATTSFNDFARRIEKACKLPGLDLDLNEVDPNASRLSRFLLHIHFIDHDFQVLLKVRNSISDRCAVEIKWARLLEDRKRVIVNVATPDLSDPEKQAIIEVHFSEPLVLEHYACTTTHFLQFARCRPSNSTVCRMPCRG